MAISRKNISAALAARLATVPGVTYYPKLRPMAELQPQDQPALFMAMENQSAEVSPTAKTKWTLTYQLGIFVYENTDSGPSETLQTILDSLEAALERQPGESTKGPHTTLGETVVAARIVGSILVDEGDLGPQASALVTVEVVVVA